jgi:hypothetical protein
VMLENTPTTNLPISLAWRIVRRREALILEAGLGHPADGDYGDICEDAAAVFARFRCIALPFFGQLNGNGDCAWN